MHGTILLLKRLHDAAPISQLLLHIDLFSSPSYQGLTDVKIEATISDVIDNIVCMHNCFIQDC